MVISSIILRIKIINDNLIKEPSISSKHLTFKRTKYNNKNYIYNKKLNIDIKSGSHWYF